jgi:hypothetical protein
MVINLIPWNPVYQPDGPFFAAPVEGAVEAFQSILRSTYGLHCTIRQEKGQDIAGGCRGFCFNITCRRQLLQSKQMLADGNLELLAQSAS